MNSYPASVNNFIKMNKILDKYLLGPKIVYLLVEAPLIAGKAEAGQFVILRLSEQGERIPLTIADYDRKEGTITLVCQEIGKTTHFLGRMQKGDYIPDVLGPQGNPTEVEILISHDDYNEFVKNELAEADEAEDEEEEIE